MHVSVQVDLDDTVANGLLVLVLGRTGATVEDKEDGLVLLGANLLLDVGLVTREQFGVQTDVTGLVDTVDVTETSGNGEVRADGGEGLVDGQDVIGLGVERVVVDVLVVDTVFLTTGDTDFLFMISVLFFFFSRGKKTYHLKPLLHGSSTLEVLGGSLNVVVDGLLGQVNHVAGVERLAVQLEVGLIGIEQTIQPREQLLGAVVGVQDDGNAIARGNAADVVGSGNTTGNGSVLTVVAHPLSGKVGSTTVGQLQDDGALLVTSRLESRDDHRRRSDVDGGNGKVLLLSVFKETQDVIAGDDTSLAGELRKEAHDVCSRVE